MEQKEKKKRKFLPEDEEGGKRIHEWAVALSSLFLTNKVASVEEIEMALRLLPTGTMAKVTVLGGPPLKPDGKPWTIDDPVIQELIGHVTEHLQNVGDDLRCAQKKMKTAEKGARARVRNADFRSKLLETLEGDATADLSLLCLEYLHARLDH